MSLITGMFVGHDESMIRTVENSPEALSALLGCDMIEQAKVYIGHTWFAVLCDEEALCHPHVPRCTVGVRVGPDKCKRLIMGPCFVVGLDEEGRWCSPTFEELKWLERAVVRDSDELPILLAEGPLW